MLEIIMLKLKNTQRATCLHGIVLFCVSLLAYGFYALGDDDFINGAIMIYLFYTLADTLALCGFTSLFGYYKQAKPSKEMGNNTSYSEIKNNLNFAGVALNDFLKANVIYSVVVYIITLTCFLIVDRLFIKTPFSEINWQHMVLGLFIVLVINISMPISHYFNSSITKEVFQDRRHKFFKTTTRSINQKCYERHAELYGDKFASYYKKTELIRLFINFGTYMMISFNLYGTYKNVLNIVLSAFITLVSCAYYIILYCIYERSQHELR